MSKKIPQALLQLLSDGEFHSGEAIGQVLGVSRAAVWKKLQKFDALGLRLESVKGKGYRLIDVVHSLDAQVITADLADVSVAIFDELDSTNAELLRRLASGPVASGAVVVAEQQTAGRGRRGREWVSPFAKNIYFSLAWNFSGGAAALDGLSLVVGLSVVEALEALGVQGAALKWPNDVLLDDKKLAGVLLEIAGDATGLCHVVIGVGLNVNMALGEAHGITQAWTSLQQSMGQVMDRSQVLNALLLRLIANVKRFETEGLAPFAQAWLRYDAFIEKEVAVSLGERQIIGIAKGITDKGLLQLEVNGELQTFNGGEVSLRRRF